MSITISTVWKSVWISGGLRGDNIKLYDNISGEIEVYNKDINL